jgi:hypothetical protein
MTRPLPTTCTYDLDCDNGLHYTILNDLREPLDVLTVGFLWADELIETDWAGFLRFLPGLDVRALLEWRGLSVCEVGGGQLLVQCPWEGEHTDGDGKAIVSLGVPERDWLPIFHCFNAQCVARRLLDILEFFGPQAVSTFCLQSEAEHADGWSEGEPEASTDPWRLPTSWSPGSG